MLIRVKRSSLLTTAPVVRCFSQYCSKTKVDSRLTACSPASLDAAAALLKRGGLVAFPTETVYGLGANGLSEAAVRSIFEAKGRPLSSPVILHVHSEEMAYPLFDFKPAPTLSSSSFTSSTSSTSNSPARKVITSLSSLWPGPLTIVHKASALVPDIVTAGNLYK